MFPLQQQIFTLLYLFLGCVDSTHPTFVQREYLSSHERVASSRLVPTLAQKPVVVQVVVQDVSDVLKPVPTQHLLSLGGLGLVDLAETRFINI